ncbi:MAG: sigma-70 family RNA polymerase sigma factor, partial [Verrucomicrobiota bacterium]
RTMSDSETNKREEQHVEFISLLSRHEPVIRASIQAIVRRPEDVDEVMQAVSIAAWKKFDTLTEPQGFAKWACVIARYEILKFQRARATDRFHLDEDLVEKLTNEGAEEVEKRSGRIRHLEVCLNRLPGPRRELVMQAYEPGSSIKDLAIELGKSVDGLYQLLRRIRLELKRCVERRLVETGKGGAA